MKKRKCPRCLGTGKELGYYICATCHGKGYTNEEICPHCHHPKNRHDYLKYAKVYDCNCESSSGQFLCGCQLSKKTIRPICNVCGTKYGNSFCLNRHLRENPKCRKNLRKYIMESNNIERLNQILL